MTAPPLPAARVVVMGVAGCGKSSVGRVLAARLGWRYIEGDELHPRENVQRMAAGTPLTDADRQGWLGKIAAELAAAAAAGRGLVVTCSALKRRYRDVLRGGAPDVRFVFLHGPAELLASRLAARRGHYMPASLLPSQLAALEPPAADEDALALSIEPPPEELAGAAEAWLRGGAPEPFPFSPGASR
ncbi:MAG: gluconokinase [Rubrivivax sp.]|nr:gluconokinase [Rubrivivax sp.]